MLNWLKGGKIGPVRVYGKLTRTVVTQSYRQGKVVNAVQNISPFETSARTYYPTRYNNQENCHWG